MDGKPSLPHIRVLLADDHAVVRAGIRQFLEQSGEIRVVAEVADGRQACQAMLQQQPDVAVLDIQMPGMSGIEVVRWARAQGLSSGLLVLTAYDDEPYVQAVLKAGANGYILKTADPEEIIRAVRDVYQGKSVLDAQLTRRLFENLQASLGTGLAAVDALTGRELEVLTLVGKGYTNKAIGAQLSISDRTVQNHLAHIFDKLHAASRTEAVMRAVSLGLIPPTLAGQGND
ncbi:MAG: response regulator transcription factor [Chloroflexi bacterium]|nr:response regulator transcription factor [Anaerolineaceae bacterium]NMB90792.1 response regulator transcription factor [Chloroflexota bacterium]